MKAVLVAAAILVAAFLLVPAGTAMADGPKGKKAGGDVTVHGGSGGGGGTQGKSQSNPDGNGVDKPYGVGTGASIQAAGTQGTPPHDGNNGCGNDADREDDNNGNCGGPKKAKAGGTTTTGGDKQGEATSPSATVRENNAANAGEIGTAPVADVTSNIVQPVVTISRQPAAVIDQGAAVQTGTSTADVLATDIRTAAAMPESDVLAALSTDIAPTSEVLGVTLVAPSAGDGGLIGRSGRLTLGLSVLGLVFLGAGIVALRKAAVRA